MIELNGKVVIITGGGRGIGYGLSTAFAKAGAKLVITGRTESTLLSAKEKLERGKELMRSLGIIEIADNDINEVSGGQLQRACICRSMINAPKMIFADEPTGALNRQSSNEVMEELCKINADGTTVMLVTHDAKVAAKCSRVLYIVDGNIQGEYNLSEKDERTRERALNNWLMEQGW